MPNVTRLFLLSVTLILVGMPMAGCASVANSAREKYYNAWESYGGYAKRERLVDDVKDARDAQEDAKEQFVSTLDQFKAAVNFDGGDLEKVYNKLNGQLEKSVGRAEEVESRIVTVRNVAKSLFEEWKEEIAEFADDPSLKKQSEDLYALTFESYEEMIAKMDAAAATMKPVLEKFNNRVLFLKHNLNARAIASLKGAEAELSKDIDSLIKDMEASIAEADEFIAGMTG